MLKLIFLTIILYIIIQHFMEEADAKAESKESVKLSLSPENETIELNNESAQDRSGVTFTNNLPGILKNAKPLIHLGEMPSDYTESFANDNQSKVMTFDKPNPWSKVIIMPLEEYPYLFHIKAKIPSLNDFESWKQVIPNIDFNPRSGELVIPSKDEASALAVANLIIINFSGQMSLENILDKNLIQISISKAKSYEMVQNKLREQIMENLYGKRFNTVETNFERDLATNKTGRVDFKNESFTDTFQHYSDDSNTNFGIDAWDGNDYSYL